MSLYSDKPTEEPMSTEKGKVAFWDSAAFTSVFIPFGLISLSTLMIVHMEIFCWQVKKSLDAGLLLLND